MTNFFEGWEWWQVALFVFFACLFYAYSVGFLRNQNMKKLDEGLKRFNDFQTSQKIWGDDGKSGLAVDEAGRKICLVKLVNEYTGEVSSDVISFSDILSSEIFEDGHFVTKASRTSHIGSELIGSLALGGVDAITGAGKTTSSLDGTIAEFVSGKKASSVVVSKIDLRLTINRMSEPIHEVNFLDGGSLKGTCLKNDTMYTSIMEQARKWHDIIATIIKSVDTEDFASASVYLHKNGVQYGPYSPQDLGQFVKQGSFSMNDHACYDGKKWVKVSQVPGVAESMIA